MANKKSGHKIIYLKKISINKNSIFQININKLLEILFKILFDKILLMYFIISLPTWFQYNYIKIIIIIFNYNTNEIN